MNAQNTRVAHDLVPDVLDQFWIGSLAQQRTHRITNQIKPAPANIGANGKSNPSIKIYMRHLRNNCTDQYGTRGKDVVFRVLRGRVQRFGLNAVAELLVKRRHPQLYDHRQHKNRNQGKRELDGFGMDNSLCRGLNELNADKQYEGRHDQTRKILVTTMALRMLGVGGLARQLKAQNAHDVRTGIGKVVHGVRYDRNRA